MRTSFSRFQSINIFITYENMLWLCRRERHLSSWNKSSILYMPKDGIFFLLILKTFFFFKYILILQSFLFKSLEAVWDKLVSLFMWVFQAVLSLWCICSFRFCHMTNYLQDTFTYFEVSTLKWLTPICMQICVLCEPQLLFVIMPKGLHNHEFKTKWGEVRFLQ